MIASFCHSSLRSESRKRDGPQRPSHGNVTVRSDGSWRSSCQSARPCYAHIKKILHFLVGWQFLSILLTLHCSVAVKRMAHSAHFCEEVRRGKQSSQPGEFAADKVSNGLRHASEGGPGIVIGVGADDVPEENRGPGTDYLLKNVLWHLRNEGFEKQAWSGAKFPCPSCGKAMRLASFAQAISIAHAPLRGRENERESTREKGRRCDAGTTASGACGWWGTRRSCRRCRCQSRCRLSAVLLVVMIASSLP